jgi:putative ABC transport system permease protein
VIGTVIGVVLGYLLGVGLVGVLGSLMDQFTSVRIGGAMVPLEAPLLAITLGIGTTVLAGLLPALSAGRVPVLVALRQEAPVASQRRISAGSWIGAGMIALGIASLLPGNTGLALVGSVVILAGLILLTPMLLRPLSRVLEPVIRWLFAREGLLAEGNLQRNPGRSSVTVSALLIALAIFVALFAVFSSIQAAYTNRLLRSLGADILLLPQGLGVWNGDVGVSEQFEQQFAQIPGVGHWSGMSYAPAQVKGATIQMLGFDPVTYPKVGGVIFDHGDDSAYAQLAGGRNAIVSGIMATSMGLKVGDTVSVQTLEGEKSYRIVGVGADYLGVKLSTLYTSKQNMVADFGNPNDLILFANLKPGADAAATRANIETLLKDYPQLTLNWGVEWREMEIKILEQLFSALSLILVALVVPSLLGLINTLAINMLERTREIGLLRAIGATRGQIRRLVVAESLLLAMIGTALGLLAGVALGYALVGVIGSTVYSTTFYFPWAGLLFAVAIALIIALLASLLPARQASQVKIVQALQYE